MTTMQGLTAQQQAFVEHLILSGGNAADAARSAGYAPESAPQAAYRLTRLPHVQAAVRAEQERVLRGRLASKALGVLEAVMGDENAPAGARVDAAKTILDRAGLPALRHVNGNDRSEQQLTEMSRAELEAFIGRSQFAIAALRDEKKTVILPSNGAACRAS